MTSELVLKYLILFFFPQNKNVTKGENFNDQILEFYATKYLFIWKYLKSSILQNWNKNLRQSYVWNSTYQYRIA